MAKPEDINGGKQTSRVSMNICSSTGTWLNGCLQPQMHYVHLSLEDPEGRLIARVALSYEQATRMLMYNGDVECTLEKYVGPDGKLTEEIVIPPKTVHARMKDRLDESTASVLKRLEDIRRDLDDMVEGDSKRSKAQLRELLSNVEVVKSHIVANRDFDVQKAEEELCEMQQNAMGQLGVYIQNKTGIEAHEQILKALLPISRPDEQLLIGTEITPVVDDYQLKVREKKSIDDMTSKQVAERLFIRLRQIENVLRNDKNNKVKEEETAGSYSNILPLFSCNATESKNHVNVTYVSYQGTTRLPLPEAREYLKFLLSIKTVAEFKTHYWYKRKQND